MKALRAGQDAPPTVGCVSPIIVIGAYLHIP